MILSIETSTSTCSIAITENESVLAEQHYFIDKSHSALLPAIIEEILNNCGVAKSDLKAIALSDGPGSYTGLRIGSSVAKGLCYVLEIPLIPISTLKAMAFQVICDPLKNYIFCPMIDARRMEVYTALYDDSLQEVLSVSAIPLETNTFSEYQTSNLLLFGNGAEKTKELFKEQSNIHYLDRVNLSAASIGFLASRNLKENDFVDIAYYEPNYFKEFVAIKSKPLI